MQSSKQIEVDARHPSPAQDCLELPADGAPELYRRIYDLSHAPRTLHLGPSPFAPYNFPSFAFFWSRLLLSLALKPVAFSRNA